MLNCTPFISTDLHAYGVAAVDAHLGRRCVKFHPNPMSVLALTRYTGSLHSVYMIIGADSVYKELSRHLLLVVAPC